MHLQCKLGEKMGDFDRKSGVLDLNRTNKIQTQVKNTTTTTDDYYNCIKVSKEGEKVKR